MLFMTTISFYECLSDGDFNWYSLRADLVPAYVRLLRDNEAEVRIAAAGKVTKFCRILNSQLAIQHILPCVKVFMLWDGFRKLLFLSRFHLLA